MGEKVPKKMNLKEIGIEKIILIAIAGIVLLLAKKKRRYRQIKMMHM